MLLNTALKALTDRGFRTFSSFPTGNNAVEKSITNVHSALNNPCLRRNYTAYLTGDPMCRFTFLARDNKLKVVYCPMLVENQFAENDDDEFILVAFMGDDFTDRQLVRLPAYTLSDIIVCVASDATCKKLDIDPSRLDIMQMWKDHEADTKIDPGSDLDWPSTDYPDNCRVTFVPKVLCLPPHFEAFHNHSVLQPFPETTADHPIWKYHQDWKKVVAYAVQGNRGGHSINSEAHPVFDSYNWSQGEGKTFLEKGASDIHDTWYTEYEMIDKSSDLGNYVMSMINPKLTRALQSGVDSLPPPDVETPATDGAPPPQPTNPFGGADWAAKLSNSIFTGIVGAATQNAASKETETEKEKKKEVSDATAHWQLFLGGTFTDKDGNELLQPATLSDSFKDMLTISKAEIAKTKLERAWRQEITVQRNKRSLPGILQKVTWEVVTAAFTRVVQRCQFHGKPLAQLKHELDKKLSALSFCRADDENIHFKRMVNNEATRDLDHIHDEDDDRKAIMTKNLFIFGEQKTYDDVIAAFSNFITFVQMTLADAEAPCAILASATEILDILQEEAVEKILRTSIKEYPFIPHTLICNLNEVIMTYYNATVVSPYAAQQLADGNPIEARLTLHRATAAMTYLKQNIWAISTGTLHTYATPQASWSSFKQHVLPPLPTILSRPDLPRLTHTPTRPSAKRAINFGTPDREKKTTRPGTPGIGRSSGTKSPGRSNPSTPTRKLKPALVSPDIEKMKGQGMFVCHDTSYPIPNHQLKSQNGKKLCINHCYLNRYCDRANCPFAHVNNWLGLKDPDDKKAICQFVRDNYPVEWARGKGPSDLQGQ